MTKGKFRIPTLRNAELTAPYMHDGSIASLDEVIERYVVARTLQITSEERTDMIAFLHSLTDREFVADPRFADPGGGQAPSPVRTGGAPVLH